MEFFCSGLCLSFHRYRCIWEQVWVPVCRAKTREWHDLFLHDCLTDVLTDLPPQDSAERLLVAGAA